MAQLVALIARHASPPGAVAAAGWAAAMAAAVTESTASSTSPPTGHTRVMRAVEADTAAYWSEQGLSSDWITQTPREVVAAAAQIADQSKAAFTANPADMRASWALAIGAAAAAEVVAQSNDHASPRRATLAGGTVQNVELVDVVDAHGCRVRTAEGHVLLDIASGLFNTPLGHRHPAPAIGMLTQASKVASVNPFVTAATVADEVASLILHLFERPDWRVVFAGSGSEGMETALRLALSAGGPTIYARPNAFHGITAGAAALSSHEAIRGPVVPSGRVRHAPISEWEAPGIGVVEPAGITWGQPPLTSAEIGHLHRFRRAAGVVIVDEVLSGLGRTLWPGLTSAWRIPADIVVLGKGLANGLAPVSAVMVDPETIARVSDAGDLDHGHTHTNHPASLGAAHGCLTALNQLTHDPYTLQRALRDAGIQARSVGWLATVDLRPTGRRHLVQVLLDAGLLGHVPTMVDPVDRLVIAPPLTSSPDELAAMTSRLTTVLAQVGRR